ncbi:hypothetical protein PRIPAC_78143, partial [Pristionchus pacificus]|uniref:Uncharacterized protein n=1 Tax=Pristionchus pacificus TaxID=54126 RepID=A0A2A6CMM2_PRIPA
NQFNFGGWMTQAGRGSIADGRRWFRRISSSAAAGWRNARNKGEILLHVEQNDFIRESVCSLPYDRLSDDRCVSQRLEVAYAIVELSPIVSSYICFIDDVP